MLFNLVLVALPSLAKVSMPSASNNPAILGPMPSILVSLSLVVAAGLTERVLVLGAALGLALAAGFAFAAGLAFALAAVLRLALAFTFVLVFALAFVFAFVFALVAAGGIPAAS